MKKAKKTGWNPLKGVSEVVERMVDAPARQQAKKPKPPAKVEHERVVLYLTPAQAYNLRKAALDRHTDTSAMARELFTKAGL